jgi:hypothetical protein
MLPVRRARRASSLVKHHDGNQLNDGNYSSCRDNPRGGEKTSMLLEVAMPPAAPWGDHVVGGRVAASCLSSFLDHPRNAARACVAAFR